MIFFAISTLRALFSKHLLLIIYPEDYNAQIEEKNVEGGVIAYAISYVHLYA